METKNSNKAPLEEKDILKFQEILRAITERRIRGFVYMATLEEDSMARVVPGNSKVKEVSGDGLLFTQDVSGPTVVHALINSVGMSAAEVLAIL